MASIKCPSGQYVNIRNIPRVNGSVVVAKGYNGDPVTILQTGVADSSGANITWTKIRYVTVEGYVQKDYVQS